MQGQLNALSPLGGQWRRVAVLTQGPTPPASGGSGSGGSGSGQASSQQSGGSLFRRSCLTFLKGMVIWVPAVLFWVSLVWGGTFFDYRTQEEVDEDEAEVRRLERFFDVEGLPEDEYLAEWTSKDEALSKIVDKLLRSQRFTDCLVTGACDARRGAAPPQTNEAATVEVSYVLPPVAILSCGDPDGTLSTMSGPRPWFPRLIISHRLGSLALVSINFEHVPGGKDREERWACTALRTDLVALPSGEPTCESICDLKGPVPHGVRYMRI